MKKTSLLVLSAMMLFFSNNIFAQVVDDEENSNENLDSFYELSNNNKVKKPFVYPYVRSADVTWKQRVWRVVDFREKMNQPFYYPIEEDQGRVNLFTVIDRAIKDGTIKVYETDEFKTEADYNKILQGAGETKTITKYETDLDGMETEKDEQIFQAMDPIDVKSMRIKEDWYVDKQRSVRDVRILGFSLIYMKQRDDEAPQTYPLGWIRYNDPAVRNLLANSEVFNPKNDVERRSYDDVFVKRLFTSYVIRTSDTYDRSISDYLTGFDALYESQNIEEDIFNREQDMWEY